MQTWTFGPAGIYTATWDGISKVTVTLTAGGAFVVSFFAQSLNAAIASPEYQAILATPPLSSNGLQLVATTGLAGFALVNATPTILSWTVPNDGNMHRLLVVGQQSVASPLTGGAIQLKGLDPASVQQNRQIFASNSAAGLFFPQITTFAYAPGQTVTVQQAAAATAGAATLYLELWAS